MCYWCRFFLFLQLIGFWNCSQCGIVLLFMQIPWHLWCRWIMVYLCYLYLFTYSGVQHDFQIRWDSCRLTITWWVSHVIQELLPFRSTYGHPRFQWGSSCSTISFMCMFSRSLFVLSLLAIILSILPRITVCNYPFGIFKRLLCNKQRYLLLFM